MDLRLTYLVLFPDPYLLERLHVFVRKHVARPTSPRDRPCKDVRHRVERARRGLLGGLKISPVAFKIGLGVIFT